MTRQSAAAEATHWQGAAATHSQGAAATPPDSARPRQPDDAGLGQPDDGWLGQPDGPGQGQPDGAGLGRPDGAGAGWSDAGGPGRPDGAGLGQPHGAGLGRPDGAGAGRSEPAGPRQPDVAATNATPGSSVRRRGFIPLPVDPEPARPPHRWGLGAYLLVEGVFLGVSVLLVLPYVGTDSTRPPPAMLLLSLTVPTLLAAGVALLATQLRGNGPRIDLGLRFERSDLRWGLAFGFGGLVLTIPAAALWSRVVGPEQANSAVAELFAGQRFDTAMAIGVFLVVWLVAPVCEEIVYRGLLWGALCRHVTSRWWAFGLTTLCFALAHFEFTRTPLLLVIAVPIGLARLYTGRLGASIIAHQLNNLLPAVALLSVLLGAPI